MLVAATADASYVKSQRKPWFCRNTADEGRCTHRGEFIPMQVDEGYMTD
jgi:hypothetical protein